MFTIFGQWVQCYMLLIALNRERQLMHLPLFLATKELVKRIRPMISNMKQLNENANIWKQCADTYVPSHWARGALWICTWGDFKINSLLELKQVQFKQLKDTNELPSKHIAHSSAHVARDISCFFRFGLLNVKTLNGKELEGNYVDN